MSDYTFVVTKPCPICGQQTRVVKLKSRIIAERTDEDFCVHYKGINPYFYHIWFCEHCGFAADEKHFLAPMPARHKAAIQDFLQGRHLGLEFTEERGVPEAVASYKLAIFYAGMIDATLAEIADGKLFVSDDMMNEAIAKQLAAQDADAPVTALTLTSHENGRLDITADTKKLGPVELSGTVDAFVHDGTTSYMKYHVRSKNIPQHGLMSWVFSRISLSMAERMVGHVDLPENVPVKIKRNTVTVDFHQVLVDSKLGQTSFHGHPLLDLVEIKSATPKDGGILFETELHVPDDVKDALLRMATEKAGE